MAERVDVFELVGAPGVTRSCDSIAGVLSKLRACEALGFVPSVTAFTRVDENGIVHVSYEVDLFDRSEVLAAAKAATVPS